MADINTNLTDLTENARRVSAATAAISSAIIAKGGTVGANDGLEDFASDIATIPSGGGGSSSIVAICTFDFIENQFFMEDESGTIGDEAFSYFEGLTSITIQNSVTSIGENAFVGCTGLETVTFEANSNLETIYVQAFYGCSALTSITIPSGVTTIESSAFEECSALTSITFEPTIPPTLGGDLGLPTTCVIRVPQGTLYDYTSANNYPDPSDYTYVEY